MKTFYKILIVLALIIVGLMLFVELGSRKTYDVPFPDIKASTDPEIIERGRYLAFGPAHCSTCHVPMNKILDVEDGLEMPLSGGWELSIPPGTFRAPNITPDPETGIGNMSDGQLARAIRYGVAHDDRLVAPFMEFQNLTDEDLIAIISFLRSQPPVRNNVPRTEWSFLGKAVLALGLIKPEGPASPPQVSIPRDSSVEYGAYLANHLAACNGCHTERDNKTGAYIGESYAGGGYYPPDEFSQGYSFMAPNITPHPSASIMAQWSEEQFIHRFKQGRLHRGSPMPWGAFSRMDTIDLKALYRYLQTVEPVDNVVAKTYFEPGEKPE